MKLPSSCLRKPYGRPGLAERDASKRVLDEIGERALEVALSQAEANPDTEVIVATMGQASAATTMRKALAMGAGSAVHVLDEQLAGADLTMTAEVLTAAIRKTGFDLVIVGNLSTDGSAGVLPAMLSEHLGVPLLPALSSVQIQSTSVSGIAALENGTMTVAAELPAIIAITEALPEPRFPNFKGIMAAKKKPMDTWSLADLGVSVDSETVSRSIVVSIAERPARTTGTKITDEGNAGTKLAAFLVSSRLA